MISRVTQNTLMRDFVTRVGNIQRDLATAEEVVSTQKKLNHPSDDPAGAAQASRINDQQADLQTLQTAVGFGTSVLSAQDTALQQADSLMTRAREIATQMSNSTMSPALRQSAAQEVAEIERSMIGLGNTSVAGRHVFGGLATGPDPFTSLDSGSFDPNNPYTGPSAPFYLRTGPGQTQTRLTTPGDQVFNSSIKALDDLRTTLAAGNAPTANLDPIDAAATAMRNEDASVGGRLKNLDDRSQQITAEIAQATVNLGSIENADTAAAISNLSQIQTALQATFQSGKVLQTSILDYLTL
jgi:flagellar hook-associated protein 3 FlgL